MRPEKEVVVDHRQRGHLRQDIVKLAIQAAASLQVKVDQCQVPQ